MQGQRPVGGEITALTGLRLVAALWVVVHHFWLFTPGHGWLRHVRVLAPLLQTGWLGVDLFFVLSGFVLTHNYVAVLGERPRLRPALTFYWARLSRIWPTWMVVLGAVIAGLLVKQFALGASPETRLDAGTVIRQVLLVQVWDRPDYSATGPVGPGWSLSAEWLAYLVFPAAALLLCRLRGRHPVVLGALALGAVSPFACTCLVLDTHDWRWSWLLRLTGCFLSGAVVSLFVRRLQPDHRGLRRSGAVAATAVLLILLVLSGAGLAGGDRAGVVVLFFPLLVGALAVGGGGVARWLSTPLVVLGGRISFALYLVHVAVFEVLWTLIPLLPALGGDSPPATLLQVAVMLLPLPVAWMLWRFVEEPARVRLRAMHPRGRARGARAARPCAERARLDAPAVANG